jgi:putative membrane protein
MARLSQSDRDRVLAAIAEAERRTSAEFAVAVAGSADAYAELRLLIPTILAVLLPPLLLALDLARHPLWLAAIPAIAFVAASAVLLPDAVAVRLVPERRRISRAVRLAQALFVELGLAAPRERAGVLLFVARAERQIDILTGPGVAERVDPSAWQEVVQGFVVAARSRPLPEALIGAIEASTALLSQAFPPSEHNPDEVANRLIEL